MNIGYDAKRAFHNNSGLGNYSRNLLRAMSDFYPEHHYYLFNPKPSDCFEVKGNNLHEVVPDRFINKLFSSAWRSSGVKRDLRRLKINLYHGLSHEIPFGIQKTGIHSVVTIHDLIHERCPEQYNPIDRRIYSIKFRYACENADKIIAISNQTKKDIIDYYEIREEKITVCYQSCNPAFALVICDEEKMKIKERYGLPEQYFLYVGSIIERKNLLTICNALYLLKEELDVPLVVIGEGGRYLKKVRNYIQSHDLNNRIIFLSENEVARSSDSFRNSSDFPAIYQSAIALIYPSSFEGFGIPVLEALYSRLPVITSNLSSLPEVGGKGAYYINPGNPDEIAAGMRNICTNNDLAKDMVEKGYHHALQFSPEKCSAAVMNVYKSLW